MQLFLSKKTAAIEWGLLVLKGTILEFSELAVLCLWRQPFGQPVFVFI